MLAFREKFKKGLISRLTSLIEQEILDHFCVNYGKDVKFSKLGQINEGSFQQDGKHRKWTLAGERWKCGFQGVVLEGLGIIDHKKLFDLSLLGKIKALREEFKVIDLSSLVKNAMQMKCGTPVTGMTSSVEEEFLKLSTQELYDLLKLQEDRDLRHAIRKYHSIDRKECTLFEGSYCGPWPKQTPEITAFLNNQSLQSTLAKAKNGLAGFEITLRTLIQNEMSSHSFAIAKLHDRMIEEENPKPRQSRFGLYSLIAVVAGIASIALAATTTTGAGG